MPIICPFDYNSLSTTKVEHKWTSMVNGDNVNHFSKMHLPTAHDPQNKELLLYVIDQFYDAADGDRLHLTTGPIRYSKFRQVLTGDLRITWQQISDSREAQKTIATFDEDIDLFIAQYFSPTSADDQREYLRSSTKPFSMSCETLAGRLRVISNLCKRLPGAEGKVLYADENQLKRAYFLMMPASWRIKFAESGQVLDGFLTLLNLIRFMSLQAAFAARSKRKTNPNQFSASSQQGASQRGRGGGRYSTRHQNNGGRGRGFYRYGGSYGRPAYGSFQPPAPYYGAPRVTPSAQPRTFPSPSGGNPSYGNRTPGRSGGRFGGRSGFRPTYGRSSGRGPVPYVPNFYVGHHHDPQEHFAIMEHEGEYEPNEQFHGENYDAPMEYQEPFAEEQYHYEEPQQQTQESTDEVQTDQEQQDAHWLQEFGL